MVGLNACKALGSMMDFLAFLEMVLVKTGAEGAIDTREHPSNLDLYEEARRTSKCRGYRIIKTDEESKEGGSVRTRTQTCSTCNVMLAHSTQK